MSERDENVDIDGTDGWGPITEGAMHPVAICAATIATLTAERDALTQRVAELETYKATAEELANSRVVMFRQFQSQIDAAIAEAGRLREALEIQGKWASSCGNNGDLPSFDELDEFRRDMDKVDTLTKATAPPAASERREAEVEITYCDTCTTHDYCADQQWGKPERQEDMCAAIRRGEIVIVDNEGD